MKNHNLDTASKINFYLPTEENVFLIISKDKTAFTVGMLLEMGIENKGEVNENAAKMISIYMNLKERGYIKSTIFENKISLSGYCHIHTTHKRLQFISIIVAIILCPIAMMKIDILNRILPKSKKEPPSVPVQLKKDSIQTKGIQLYTDTTALKNGKKGKIDSSKGN